MEKILKLYTYVDGTNDTPFPNDDEQIIIGTFTYTANRMAGAPTITATIKHRLCLDDLWNDKVYAEFNGEKYFIINTPSSSKSNDDARYEHDLELLSEREVLNHVYFIDAVQGDSDVDQYKSNSTKVQFYGNLSQFVERLNASLSYRNLDYTAVIDEGISTEDKNVTFEDKYILEALQEEFNIFEIPYYFVGKTIHFGYTANTITTPFKYGYDSALLSISKDNANYALINRITGVGSSDNIPYYYPNESDDRAAIIASGKKWITPSQNLMPPVYRETNGAERFYNAKNNTYSDGEGGYYEFENEYSDSNPREGITDFEDIKPTIVGITNSSGQRIDSFIEFAYDTNDNDEMDEEGNYLHPYFFAKLRKTDGTYGFNLFDQAIENQSMQISFTSGVCGACSFEIAVGDETQKNLVQVGDSGALMRDENGNVLCGRKDLQQPQIPQDRQNDTRNYEVWIALRKDDTTYPQLMPNVNYNYKPATSDTFVILGINLPQAYILKAEDDLEKSLIKYMWMNNVEKFTFSAKFSRIFFDENPDILSSLNENSRVIIEYNGKQHTLYINSYTYKMDSSSPLPEIDIDLVDTLSIGQNSLQTQLDSVKQDILSSIGGGDFLKTGLKYFLRKDIADTAKGKITFLNGIDIGTFTQNAGGGTFRILEDASSYAEVDRLRVRVKAYFETLEIINTNSVGGKMILTAGGGVYLREVVDRETSEDGTETVWDYYRCYFLTQQDGREIENRFKVGDLAISQSFNIKAGISHGVTNHYYWREVVGVGDDYIDLSKSICDTGSDAPMAEDTVCHLGNRTDKDRQGAIIFSAVEVFSPSITLYYGINDFSLVNKDYVNYGVDKTTGNAFFRVYGEMYTGDREQKSYMKYTPDYGVEIKGKFLNTAGESISDLINNIQNQVDGAIETWFYEPEPTLENQPAINWTTDEEKNNHLGDLYYSGEGKAYRFQVVDGVYEWHLIQDTDITKALAEAQKAQQAAQKAQSDAEAAKGRLDEWAADGVISPTEKQGIRDEVARIDADKANITSQYSKYGLGEPTAFNKAYNEYRALLVQLGAANPDIIPIPSDFSTKQTYYYNERTTALGAIADASIESVTKVSEQIQAVQKDVNNVKTDVNNLKTSVDGMRNFTDDAFADGIVDRSESASIAKYINSIETFAKDVQESYNKVYNNPLLAGTDKTNLGNAYTAFNTAKNELVSTINGVISDGKVNSSEKSSVDGKYSAFNTKYGDFIAYLNAANKYIQDVINKNATDALKKIGELDYLKAALKEYTSIEGGLIQSSTLALGYTSSSGYTVMAGTNGIYDSSKLGGGIASWWGGAMFDRFEYTTETMPANVAKGLIRMDGTGYFANGNLWWEADGTLHADPLSFFVGPDSVGNVLGLFQFVKSDAGIEYVIPQYPFQKLEVGNYIQIGKAQLYWDETNKAFYVRHEDGSTPVGFYATGWISAMGANPNAGGTVSGATALSELSDVQLGTLSTNQVLAWNGNKWTNVEMAGSSNLTFTTTGSGNVVSSVLREGDTVTVTKGITAALNNGSNASGTWGISITGSSARIESTSISSGSLADKKTAGYLYHAGGNNSVTDKPSGVDAFGMFTMQTADGWQGQLLMSSNQSTGLYWRTANNNFNGGWRTIIDSSNYASIIGTGNFVKKSGDTMSGDLAFATIASWPTTSGETYPINSKGISWGGSSDNAKIFYRVTGSDAGNLVLQVGDDSNANIIFENTSAGTMATLYGNGNLNVKGTITAPTFSGTATNANFLKKNTTFNSTAQAGLQYYDADIQSTTNDNNWSAPSTGWHQIIHMPLSVSGYFTEIALPVNDVNGLAWRQRRSGSYYGWYRILDTNNYASTLDGRYIKKAGDTMTGTLNFANNTWNKVGDDVYIGDINVAGQLGIKAANTTNPGIAFYNSSNSSVGNLVANGTTLQWRGSTIWHAGNDGSGSGLDADLLDGTHKSDLLTAVSSSSTTNLSVTVGGTTKSVTDLYANDADKLDGYHYTSFPLRIGGTYYTSSSNPSVRLFRFTRSGDKGWIRIAVSDSNNGGSGIASKYVISWSYNSSSDASTYPVNISCLYSTVVNVYNRLIAVRISGATFDVYYTPNSSASEVGYVLEAFGNCTIDNYSAGVVPTPTATYTSSQGSLFTNISGSLSGNASTATKLQTARQINGTNFDGSANITTAKWGNSRTLTLGSYLSGSVTTDGSANVTLNANVLGLTSQGGKTAISGTTMPAEGLRLYNVYNNGYPCTYGNLISVKGQGAGELLLEWTGSSALGHIRYRSKRDNNQNGWSDWGTVAFQTDNVASATKLQTARTLWGQSFNGTANVSGSMTGVGSISASGAISTSSTITASGVINANGGINLQQGDKINILGNGNSWINNGAHDINAETLGGDLANIVISSWYGLSFTSSCSGTYQNKTVVGINCRSGKLSAYTIYAKTGMYSDGYVSAKGQNSSSDIRLKNILCDIRMSIKDFSKAPLFKFAWKSNADMVEVGSSAQYWKNILPDAVKERNGFLEMGYGNIALAGVITIARGIETLEERVKRLEIENRKMKEQISKFKKRIA